MNRKEFQQLAKNRVLLLDGAAGSNFLLAGMPAGVCSELWLIEHPQALLDLQKAYVEAGTQILYAPTFGGNRFMLEEKHVTMPVEEVNRRIVELSREAAQGKALIAGDMTMTGRQLIPNGQMSIHEAIEGYKEQAKALYEAGVDLFVVETMVSLQEMRAAVLAIREVCDLPVLATFTVDANGFTFLGTEITAAAVTLERMGVDAVGLNCSMGPDQMGLAVQKMKQAVHIPVIAKANAGHPEQEDGRTVYRMTPEKYAACADALLDAGVDMIGGCCGTTPATIQAVYELLKKRGQYAALDTEAEKAVEESKTGHIYDSALTSARSIFNVEEAEEISYAGCTAENEELAECLKEQAYEDLIDALEDAEDCDLLFVDVDSLGENSVASIEPLMGTIASMNLPVCLRTERMDVLKEALVSYCGSMAVKKNELTESEEARTWLISCGAVVME